MRPRNCPSQFPAGKKMGYALRNYRYRFVAWFKTGGGGVQLGDQIAVTELYDYASDPLNKKTSWTILNTKR